MPGYPHGIPIFIILYTSASFWGTLTGMAVMSGVALTSGWVVGVGGSNRDPVSKDTQRHP